MTVLQYDPAGLIREATRRAFADGHGFAGLEIVFVRRDGSTGQGLVGNHPLTIGDEQYGLGTLIDLTERKQIEVQWPISKGSVDYDAEHRPVRMAGVFIDITARKRTEESQLRSQKMEALGTLCMSVSPRLPQKLIELLITRRPTVVLQIHAPAGENDALGLQPSALSIVCLTADGK